MTWVFNEAPVSEPSTLLVLLALADHADKEGRNAFPSQATIATYARLSTRSVGIKLTALMQAGVIKLGDQEKVKHYPPNRRPKVYDIDFTVTNVERVGSGFGVKPASPEDLSAQKPTSPQEVVVGVKSDAPWGEASGSFGVKSTSDKPKLLTPINTNIDDEVPQQEEGTEAPIPIHRPRSRKKWKPSPQAWDTAVNEYIHYLDKEDLGTIVASYELWCHEKKKEATSAGWLRWVLREEAATKEKRMAEQAAKRKREPWHAVAE